MPNGTDPSVRDIREEAPPRTYLQPIAAPSILGLYGFAGATFMVAAHMAHWYGYSRTDLFLAPMCALFGGVAQYSAGMWAYKARDGLATAMHGMWGAFWIAFGLLQWAIMAGLVTPPGQVWASFGYWFIILGAITWVGAWAALAENMALTLVLGWLASGCTAAAISFLTGTAWVSEAAGYCFIVSALVAFYTASALMLEASHKRPILPVGKTPLAKARPDVVSGVGEPGVVRGQ